MKYLWVILWLFLGVLYYWIWNNSETSCCTGNGVSSIEQIAPAETDSEEMANISTTENEESASEKAAREAREAEAAAAAKKKADEAAEKAIADAAKTNTVTSVKTTDASGVNKLSFYFPYNSSQSIYSAGTESDLSEIVNSAKASGKKVVVSGHTDDRGDSDSNMRLGKWRADEVMKKLISKGLPAAQIVSRSYGEERPVASNNTSEGRQKNRRVELIIE